MYQVRHFMTLGRAMLTLGRAMVITAYIAHMSDTMLIPQRHPLAE